MTETSLPLTGADERPLRDRDKFELFREAEANWDSLGHVALAAAELLHRKKLRKRDLPIRDKIVSRRGELIDAWFRWMEANAQPGASTAPLEASWPQVGVLKHMGYSTGQNGRSDSQRRAILDQAFGGTLPFVMNWEHMAEWGSPATPARLRKIAWSLASFANHALRRADPAHSLAIAQWTGDLEYLRVKYYVGKFGFDWPEIG